MRDTFDVEIRIQWNEGHGRAVIYRDRFFPAPAARLKAFLKKIVALDYEHEREILIDIDEYLAYNVYRMDQELTAYRNSFPEKKKELARRYSLAIDNKSRIEDLAKTKKYPNGVRCENPPSKAEVKVARDIVKDIEREFRELQAEEGKILKRLEAYKKNAEIIRERLEVMKY